MIGESPRFLAAVARIGRLAACDAPVLIHGETGSGKELAARAIHYLGARRDGPFLPVNCGAIPDSLLESEFFGHNRGAFTDAKEPRIGLIEQAQSGTLFVDELEALSPRGQVTLLRFLQDGTYRPVGSSTVRHADTRIVGSTNADLAQMVARGTFRSDLLFRLDVLNLTLPPLRDRPGDARLLAERFVREFSARYGLPPRPLDARACAYLETHQWPGNVRELENLTHRACLLSEGPDICFDVAEACAADTGAPAPVAAAPHQRFSSAKAHAIAEFERAYIADLLQRTRGNISLAARLCGKERSRLGKLVKKHGLERLASAARHGAR